jgi:hypothetical protein
LLVGGMVRLTGKLLQKKWGNYFNE